MESNQKAADKLQTSLCWRAIVSRTNYTTRCNRAVAGHLPPRRNRHTKVQSTTYTNYSFVRMDLEDRNRVNQLIEQEKFGKVCNSAASLDFRPDSTRMNGSKIF